LNSKEELKQQLAESGMANATKEMVNAAKDIGLISKELEGVEATKAFYKLQEQGEVISEEILPAFAKRLKEVASVGLDKKLESNAVAMQRLVNVSLPMVGNEFFKAGWGEGLTDLFNTLADSSVDLIPLFKGLGRVLGGFVKGIARLIDVITPPLRVLGNALDWITEKMGDFSGVIGVLVGAGGIMALTGKISKLTGVTLSLGGVAKATAKALKVGWLLPILAIVDALKLYEDMMTQFFWKDRITANYDPRLDEDSKYYDPNFKKEEKESTLFGYDNFKLRKDPFGGLKSGLNNVLGWFSKFNYENGVSQGNPLTKGNTPIQVVVNHKTIVDGEEVASSVVKTDQFTNGVNTTILPLMQGGE